jgi:hypothetical protein
MQIDSAFWRSLRADFESLQGQEFRLTWNSRPLTGFPWESPGATHWAWVNFPDESLKARLGAMALRGARALGYDSEDGWYDQLRKAFFGGVDLTGSVDTINDVVKESITLCYTLEATAAMTLAERREWVENTLGALSAKECLGAKPVNIPENIAARIRADSALAARAAAPAIRSILEEQVGLSSEPANSGTLTHRESQAPRVIADQTDEGLQAPTLETIKDALDAGERKRAVQLRIRLDGCTVKTLWSEAFSSRRCKTKTMQTAFNRWQASRKGTPSWADKLIRARLLKPPPV